MKATFRIVTPAAASAAVAALLLTGCADKPVRIPGGSFVEEPYSGETTSRSQTLQSNGEKTYEAEVIYIENDVPVGPVENEGKAGAQQGDASAQQGGASVQQGGSQLQPVEQQPVEKSNVPEGSVEYKVVKGDTLWGIGMVYGVSVARLAEINGLDEKAPLKIGQVIMIPPDAKNAVGKPIPQKKDTKPAASTATKADSASSAKPAASASLKSSTSSGDSEKSLVSMMAKVAFTSSSDRPPSFSIAAISASGILPRLSSARKTCACLSAAMPDRASSSPRNLRDETCTL